jgi:hypothetical protein
MVRPSSRVALLLCVLLVLQEFGPAHFAKVKPLGRYSLEKLAEEPDEGKNIECTPYIRETITKYLERKNFYFSTK